MKFFTHRVRFIALLLCAFLLATGCDKPEDKAQKFLARGNALFEKEDYVKARLEYRNAARLLPTSAEVRYRLGLVDEAENNFQSAFKNFMHAEQQDNHFHPALLKLAQYMMASDQLAEAEKYINTVFELATEEPQAHAILAAVRLRQNNNDEAQRIARHALSIDPANITATAVLTGLYQKRGELDKADAVLEEGIKNNPNDISLLLLKASMYEKAGNIDKIKQAYDAIFAIKPQATAYRITFANHLIQANQHAAAEAFLRDSTALFPDDWAIKQHLVRFLGKTASLETTESEINKLKAQYPDKDELYFWLAELYIQHNDINKAAALLRQLVETRVESESSLSARASLARIHIAKGDRALAENLVRAVLDKEPSHPDALFIRASLAMDDGAYQNAITDLRTIIRDNPRTQTAYQLLAEALLAQGRINLAIDTLGQMEDHATAPNLPARVRLAQMFEANNNPAQGIAILQHVIKMDPDYPYGWESLARLAISAKNPVLAQEAIEKLRTMDKPYQETAQLLHGRNLLLRGQKEQATAQLKSLIQDGPDRPIAEHALATLAETLPAEDMIAFLDSLEPQTAYIKNRLGALHLNAGNQALAAQAYDDAIQMEPMQPSAFVDRARMLMNENKHEQALPLLTRVMEHAPSNYIAPILVADIYKAQGKYDDAIKVYEDVLARNPDVHAAANNMADLITNHFASDRTKMEKARLAAERFISSPNPLLLDTLAWVYYKQGNTEQALTVIERALALGKDDLPPVIHYHHGHILFDLGQKDKAKAALQKALEGDQTYDGAADAKSLLGRL